MNKSNRVKRGGNFLKLAMFAILGYSISIGAQQLTNYKGVEINLKWNIFGN